MTYTTTTSNYVHTTRESPYPLYWEVQNLHELNFLLSDPILLSKDYCTMFTFIVLMRSGIEKFMYVLGSEKDMQILGLLITYFNAVLVFVMKYLALFNWNFFFLSYWGSFYLFFLILVFSSWVFFSTAPNIWFMPISSQSVQHGERQFAERKCTAIIVITTINTKYPVLLFGHMFFCKVSSSLLVYKKLMIFWQKSSVKIKSRLTFSGFWV